MHLDMYGAICVGKIVCEEMQIVQFSIQIDCRVYLLGHRNIKNHLHLFNKRNLIG